ncbi:hypothetical protein LXL04_014349 [Taraxacum kok-saghyz]
MLVHQTPTRRLTFSCIEGSRAIPWVKWSEILKRKEDGGLGVNSLMHLNIALSAKWIWRFYNEKEAAWVQVIKSIHGADCLNYNNSMKSSNWKHILKNLDGLKNAGMDLRSLVRKKCGDGVDTLFWLDPWLTHTPLKDKFPRLFALESDKYVLVSGRLRDSVINWNWIRDPARGCTGDNLEELAKMLTSIHLNLEKDRWIILEAPKETFTVAWYRDFIQRSNSTTSISRNIWSSWVPKRNLITVWRVDKRKDKDINKKIMETIIMGAICSIWKHRNEVCFEKKKSSIDISFVRMQEETFCWISSRAFKLKIDRSFWFMSAFGACDL